MFNKILAAFVLVMLAARGVEAAPPLGAYGKLPAIEDMTLSPDGKTFAFVSVEGDKRRLFVDTVEGEVLRTVSLGEMKTRYLKWAGSEHLLIFISTTLHHRSTDHYEYEMMSAVSLNVKTGKTLELLTKRTSILGNILGYYGSAEVSGRRVGYFRSQQFGGASLFKVDLEDGSEVTVSDIDTHAHNWVLDDQGHIVARSAFKSRQ